MTQSIQPVSPLPRRQTTFREVTARIRGKVAKIGEPAVRTPLLKTGAAIVATAGLSYGLLHTELFAVEQVHVTGVGHLTRDDVLGTSSHLATGKFLIDVQPDTIERRLEANPWVESASVERSWPHTVKVHVDERVPLGVSQLSDKRWAVLGDQGMVLEVSINRPVGLPNLLGVEAPAQTGEHVDAKFGDLLMVASMLPESIERRVTEMDQTPNGLRLGVDAGTIVELGDTENLGAKLTSAAAVLSRNDASKIKVLDVRSPESPLATPHHPA